MPTVSFTTPGANTYQRLPGVNAGTAKAWAGGGGGSGAPNTATAGGVGGGGGEYRSAALTGMTAASYSVTVGAGAAGGLGTSGSAGTASLWDAGANVNANPGLGGSGAFGAGGSGGTGTTGNNGGNGGTTQSLGGGGGGGGGAGSTAAGGVGGDGVNPTGGAGGTGGATGGGAGGTGPDYDAGGTNGSDGSTFGGGGSGSGNGLAGDVTGGAGIQGKVEFDYTNPTLEITQQPTNANSGVAISPSMTVRIKCADTTIDNNANTAGGALGISVAILTGTGVIGGTTTQNYGASGTCTFNDITITGSGAHTLRFTDVATGVTVDSSSFTITAAAGNNKSLLLTGVG